MKFKKNNLITTGLSSEAFLLLFLEPGTTWEVAWKLSKSENTDKSKKPSNYSKVYDAITALEREKYLKRNFDDNKLYPRLSSITKDIESFLNERNVILDESEKKILKLVLDHRNFLKIISSNILSKLNNQNKGIHKINALDVITTHIGSAASACMTYKIMNPDTKFFVDLPENYTAETLQKTLDEFKSEWEKIFNNPDYNLKELGKQKLGPSFNEKLFDLVIGVFQSMPDMTLLFLIPDSLLDKLAMMWSGHEGTKMVLDQYKFQQKSEKSE